MNKSFVLNNFLYYAHFPWFNFSVKFLFSELETLSENFKSLLLNKESCDTTLFVKDKEYKAHRVILIARSSVFGAMFQHETSEKQTGIVNIPDCDAETFGEFLEFLYTGKLEEPSPQSALHLYETSEKYNIEELKTLCSEFLMENWTIEILCDAVILADTYDDAKLLSAAQDFFTKNLNNILLTPQWDSFLKNNHRLANKLLIAMSSKVHVKDVN